MKVDLEFRELLGEDYSDAHLAKENENDEQIDDTFSKVFRDIEHGVDREKLAVETQDVNGKLRDHYAKIAASVVPPAEARVTADPQRLEKRFSQPDARSAYREFFKSRQANGQTASAALEEWLAEFPHHNPDVERLLRETAEEFA